MLSSSAQGLSRTIYIDPETAEELPIIDEHDIGRYGRHAAHARLSDDRHGPRVPNANSGMQRVEPPQKYIDLTREIMPAQRAVAQPAYVRDRTVQREDNFGTRQPSPRSRQYQPVNLRPPGADQDSIQTFSHSRIDGSASNAANPFQSFSKSSFIHIPKRQLSPQFLLVHRHRVSWLHILTVCHWCILSLHWGIILCRVL